MNLALALAAGDGGGPGRDNVRRAADDRELAEAVVARVLPGADVPALAARIAVELSRVPDADADERRALALGLALGSPEFQAR